jgi:hypothetical protein
MSTPIISAEPLITAVVTAVEGRGIPFGDGKVPTRVGTKPWIVGWFDSGTHGDDSLSGNDGWSVDLTAHCLGPSAEAARLAAAHLAAALRDLYGTTVDTRVVHAPEQLSALPAARDDTTTPPQWDAVVEWRLRTSAA